jgi:serine/threonine-protein kinase
MLLRDRFAMTASEAAPRIVGRYALFGAIAAGGMASVHLGRLMGPVGFSRTVAVKRLHESFATDPDFVAMFLDEARLAARIRHPNVVPTLDVVAFERELLLVMEYVAGESLSLLLRRVREAKRLAPIPVVADIVVNVLAGLHAAHDATDERGQPLLIVHRDVSPQNILVGTDGVARVLDFGVAKAVGTSHQTREGQVKGKVRYMAPEQIHGRRGIARTVDVYAASIVLWEALTGERMFKAENDVGVMYEVLQGRAEPPSRLRPDVGRALDEVVLRGLAAKPEDRFPTAQAMAAALEAAVAPVPRSAVAAWVREHAGPALEARRARVAFVESTGMPDEQNAGSTLQPVSAEPSAVSTVTPPSVERSVRTETPVDAGWFRRAPLVPVFGAAIVIGAIAAVLAIGRSAPPASASAATAGPPPVAALPVVAVPAVETPPSLPEPTEPTASAHASTAATPPSVVAPPVWRPDRRAAPASAKPGPAKTSSPDRLYRRD